MAEPPIFIWCEIVCRQCSHASPGHFTRGRMPRAKLRKDASASGWQFVYGECFCSISCLHDFEAETEKDPQP